MCISCNILNIGTRDPDINPPDFEGEDELVREVYEGEVSPENLPESLYLFSFFAFVRQLVRNFGLPSDFATGSQRAQIAQIAKDNMSIFSGAKTFQNVLELSINTFDSNGQLLPFSQFRLVAANINDQYNRNYLRTELNASFRQTQAIENWQQVVEDAETFPYLQYSTVGDSRVRPSHRAINGVVKRADSDFWDTWFPPNGWNCRCIIRRLREGAESDIQTPKNEDENFNTNVGKTGLVFPLNHPYLDVPPQFRQARENNFGFTVPTDTDIRDFLDES